MTKKQKQKRGGVIPYHITEDGEIKMMFMRPSDAKYGGPDWQIAKGKIDEEDDDIEAGSFREAEEELGLFTPNTKNAQKLGTFLGHTTVFITEVIDPSPEKFGDPTDETKDTKWMTLEEFLEDGRDLHKPVVKAAVRAIENR